MFAKQGGVHRSNQRVSAADSRTSRTSITDGDIEGILADGAAQA